MGVIQRKAFQGVVGLDEKEIQGGTYTQGTMNGNMNIPTYYNDVEGSVFLHGNDFKEIFDVKRANSKKYKNRLPIVKITRKETGQSIHRMFQSCHTIQGNRTNDFVALTYTSLLQLSISKEDYEQINELTLSRGAWFPYYWNHPHHATRISMRLGFISLIISTISLVIAL